VNVAPVTNFAVIPFVALADFVKQEFVKLVLGTANLL